MNTGIICEYNPFHNGHLHQLNQIKALQEKHGDADNGIIACISGGCTQRGTVHLIDKWTRAGIAVKNGVNLVLELPAIYCLSSAQNFATGGVQLFNQLGIVDTLAFGTEFPDSDVLFKAADVNIDEKSDKISQLMGNGKSYGAAISMIIAEETNIPEAILKEPNTILAIEYMRAIKKINSAITPIPLQRVGTQHHDSAVKNGYASGTAIRNMLKTDDLSSIKKVVPSETADAIEKVIGHLNYDAFTTALRWAITSHTVEELAELAGVSEGMEFKLKEAANCSSIEEMTSCLVNRHYPLTRVQRMLAAVLLRLDESLHTELLSLSPQYIRILAFDQTGRKLLKQIKKQSPVPIISKTADFLSYRDCYCMSNLTPLQKQLYIDIQTQNLFSLVHHEDFNSDFVTSPIYAD